MKFGTQTPFALTSLLLAVVAVPACDSSGAIRGDCPNCMPNNTTVGVYCDEHDGDLEYRTDAGTQYGVCKFHDGSECEAWAFYGKRCKPGDCAKWETCAPGIDSPAAVDSGAVDSTAAAPDDGNIIGMPNPASVNCGNKRGHLEIRSNAAGQYGVCQFSDGSECEEWAFFRGDCKLGDCTTWESCAPLPDTSVGG